MDDSDKTREAAVGVTVEMLDDTMEEVVETLDLTVQAAEIVQDRSLDPAERDHAAEIQEQAEAMLDAAEERPVKSRRPPRRDGDGTLH
ncbi:MAG TPA: hypothetical protein VD978_32215 [Azospirillum sp.]|nr:hypothetical protein [Azospirillum sp.]